MPTDRQDIAGKLLATGANHRAKTTFGSDTPNDTHVHFRPDTLESAALQTHIWDEVIRVVQELGGMSEGKAAEKADGFIKTVVQWSKAQGVPISSTRKSAESIVADIARADQLTIFENQMNAYIDAVQANEAAYPRGFFR